MLQFARQLRGDDSIYIHDVISLDLDFITESELEKNDENKFNPEYRIANPQYVKYLHSLRKQTINPQAAQILCFREPETDCFHVVTALSSKTIHYQHKNSKYPDTLLAWFFVDLFRVAKFPVKRHDYELNEIDVKEDRERALLLFSLARHKGKKIHNVLKRVHRHKNLTDALDRFQMDPKRIWK